MKKSIVWLVICTMFIVGLVACGGGGGSSPVPGTSYTVSGVASKGPIIGATVTVYGLDALGVQGAVLATALTGINGDYTANIGSYTGSILAIVSGGTYTDEATLLPVTNTTQLQAAVPNVSGNVSVAVTPLTEIAVQRAGTLTAANIESANALVSNMIGGVNIITTQPANVLISSPSTTAEKNYGLALAAISQMVSSGTATSVSSAISQIANDLADNKLDTAGGNISSALNTFIASSNNQTGLTTTTASVVQSIINSTATPIGTSTSIVGSWLVVYGVNGLRNNATSSYAAWTFYANGTYTAWDSDTSSQDPGGVCGYIDGSTGHNCSAGREWGTYSYDAVNHILAATSTIDENGANGFTLSAGQTWTSSPGAFTVNGDLISVVIGTNTATLNRVVDSNNPIVGSWLSVYGVNGLRNNATSSYAAWTFYANGTYTAWDSDTSSQDPGGVCGYIDGSTGHNCSAGREWGTYSYDAVNHILMATSTIDENGANGFTLSAGQTWTSSPGAFTVNGDLISVIIGTNTATLNRVK